MQGLVPEEVLSGLEACDCHVHMKGSETVDSIERALDRAGLRGAVLFTPYPGLGTGHVMGVEEFRRSVEFGSRIQRGLEGRVAVFAFFEPRMSRDPGELRRLLEWALTDKELSGVKMIPAGWYPYEELLDPVYRLVDELGLPITFHCGISWAFPDSSRFCRPVYYEKLAEYPRLRFALAHICWPWVDEALAVAGKFLYAIARGDAEKCNLFIDITPGTPPLWRADALRKAVTYLGHRLLIYGSDCFGADNAECLRQHLELDLAVMKHLAGFDINTIRDIMGRNASRFLGRDLGS